MDNYFPRFVCNKFHWFFGNLIFMMGSYSTKFYSLVRCYNSLKLLRCKYSIFSMVVLCFDTHLLIESFIGINILYYIFLSVKICSLHIHSQLYNQKKVQPTQQCQFWSVILFFGIFLKPGLILIHVYHFSRVGFSLKWPIHHPLLRLIFYKGIYLSWWVGKNHTEKNLATWFYQKNCELWGPNVPSCSYQVKFISTGT